VDDFGLMHTARGHSLY